MELQNATEEGVRTTGVHRRRTSRRQAGGRLCPGKNDRRDYAERGGEGSRHRPASFDPQAIPIREIKTTGSYDDIDRHLYQKEESMYDRTNRLLHVMTH